MEGYLRVTAPFDGVVTERNIHPGALVGPNSGQAAGMPMVRVVQNDRLRLVVPVPEAYTSGVTTGVVMFFTVPCLSGSELLRHRRAHCAGGRHQDAHDGRRARRDES